MRRNISIEFIKKEIMDRNGTLLEYTKFDGVNTKLSVMCNNGHTWTTRAHNLLYSNCWCPICYRENIKIKNTKSRKDKALSYAKNFGGECLSDNITKINCRIKWKCSKGHVFFGYLDNMIKHSIWCPICSGHRKIYSIEEIKKIAKDRGGLCLSEEYINSKYKYSFLCADGHMWQMTSSALLRGTWCPKCSYNLGEEISRRVFDTYFCNKFLKVKPKWLTSCDGGRLELDGYCSSLNIAFEYQGKQHREPIFGLYDYERLLLRDKEKYEICKKKNIELIYINQLDLSKPKENLIDNILNCISSKLNITKKIIEVDFSDLFSSEINKISRIIKDKGTLLSTEYFGNEHPLKFLCKCGHYFYSTPKRIKKGYWCPVCSKFSRKPDLEIYRRIATSRNGLLLSTKYAGSHSKLLFKCKEGHLFSSRAYQVKNVHSWCPECAGNKKLSLDVVQLKCKELGGSCLSTIYKNSCSKLLFECNKKHKWEAVVSSVLNGHWCPYCTNRAVKTIEYYIKLANTKNGYCLSTSVRNNKQKLAWRCKLGHEWFARGISVTNGGWCPTCFKLSKSHKCG